MFVHREILPCLPPEEKWGLRSQLSRASQSIPANIAEGHGRYYYQDNVRFCYIARGSLEEALSHIVFAREVGYIDDNLFDASSNAGDVLTRMINGYISYLKRSKRGENEPGSKTALREHSPEYQIDYPDQPET